jgi:hypothetical protein
MKKDGGTLWLRHCATSRKVAGTRPDDMNLPNLPAELGLGVYSVSNRKIIARDSNENIPAEWSE